jgi:hypothetical protein
MTDKKQYIVVSFVFPMGHQCFPPSDKKVLRDELNVVVHVK